jgi:release factor glutamine methyltransferase
MRINQALQLAGDILTDKGVESSRADARIILCFCLDKSKEYVIFNPNISLSKKQEDDFFKLVKRREAKEPISYIIGKREFFGIDFVLGGDVLDPRPDSESLIELILENFPTDNVKRNNNLKILELGVGSGCLILTILKYLPNSSAIAVDYDKNALKIAQKNSTLLNLDKRINFIKSRWFEKIDKNTKFNLIISNPPYIKTADINNLQEEVRNFEPKIALDGGEDGLNCYREIANEVGNYLSKDGILVVEIGQNQENEVIEIFENSGLKFTKYKKDLAGIIRCLMFRNGNSPIVLR